MDPLSTLPPRRALFVREYLKDLNAARAARAAGYSQSYSHQGAYRLLQDPEIAAAVADAQKQRLDEVKVEANDVLRMLLDVATADPNDVLQVRRLCCRHCWGKDFRYQRTAGELARDRTQHLRDEQRKQKDADKGGETDYTPTAFDEQGGDGYNRLAEPNDDCPECFGEGVADVHLHDSRLLQGPAKRLYAGVKTTQHGVEVKLRDQDKAVELLGRHLALFADRVVDTGETDLAKAILAARRRTVEQEPGSDLC
jgi:phage terminase small subunit